MSHTPLSRREWAVVIGLAATALVLRLFWLRFQQVVTPDGVYYVTLGRQLMAGNLDAGLSAYWPPLYPGLIGLFSFVFDDSVLAGRMVSVVLGSLLVVLEYFLIRKVWGARAAWIGGLLLVFHPQLVDGSAGLLSDVPYTAFLVAGVLLGMVSIFEGRPGVFFWCGVAFGACYLTRPEGFAYVWLIAVMALVSGLRRSASLRRIAGGVGLLLIGFAAMAVPYILYLESETGDWTISAKLEAHLVRGWDNWLKLPDGAELTYADTVYAGTRPTEGGRVVTVSEEAPPGSDQPGFLRRTVAKFLFEYRDRIPRVFPPLILILVGVGLVARGATPERRLRELYLLCILVASLVGYGIANPEVRYLMSQVPLVYGWVACGIAELGERARDRGVLAKAAVPGAILVLALSMLPEITYTVRQSRWDKAYELKLAGSWLRERSPEPPVILANTPVVAFYAGAAEFYYAPDEPLDVLIEHARRLEVDYFVVDEYKVRRKALHHQRPLLSREGAPPGLRPIWRFDEVAGSRVVIYELDAEEAAGPPSQDE